MPDATIARINVSPVKSTRLRHPDQVRVETWGIVGNREFFLLDGEGRLWNGSKQGALVALLSERIGDELSLTFPDGTQVSAPTGAGGDAVTVDFYGRPVTGRVVPGPWDGPLAGYAGAPIRLVRPDEPGGANDVWPLSFVSEASVSELARAGEVDHLDGRRFRMNFDIAGCDAFAEESWDGRMAKIGSATVRMLGRIPRCVVTTQDPDSGQRDFSTLSVIKRSRGVVDGDLLFGVYGEIVEPGEIAVGDGVELR